MLPSTDQPSGYIVTTRRFWRKWRPLLGSALTMLIIEARQRCYQNRKTGESRAWFHASMSELGGSLGFSARKVARLLRHPLADRFIHWEPTYRYDPTLGKKVRGKGLFTVALGDPLAPAGNEVLVENDSREQALLEVSPAGQNVRKAAPSREPPAGQNVRNIYNTMIINNINNVTTANPVPLSQQEVRPAGAEEEEVIAAVRRYFQNRIGRSKIAKLITETGLENVRDQLAWFPCRDISWARNGPVAAFVTFCELEMSGPESRKTGGGNEVCTFDKSLIGHEAAESVLKEERAAWQSRRERYEEAAQYDTIYADIIGGLSDGGPLVRSALRSCFIGEILEEGLVPTVVIDAPNAVIGNWLEKNLGESLLALIHKKVGTNALLKIEFAHRPGFKTAYDKQENAGAL